MSKIGYYNVKEKERELIIKSMFKSIASLEKAQDVEKFFCDLLSLDEIIMVGRRMQIAKMLLEGHTREEVVEQLRVGASTVKKIDN